MSHNFNLVNNTEPNSSGNFTINTNQFFMAGRGLTDAYSNSPTAASFGTNTRLYFYDTSPLNNISNLTVQSTNGWIEYLTLPVGKYRCSAFWSGIFSSSGSMDFSFRLNSGYVGNAAVIGATVNATLDGASIATAFLNVTASSTLEVVCVATPSNMTAPASQGNVPAEESWIFVERLE